MTEDIHAISEKLVDLLQKVREENLDLPTVEKYRDSLIHLRTDLKRHEAALKKRRALALIQNNKVSVAQRKLQFDATEDGLALIDVQGDLAGLGGEIDALQSRIYSLIR